MSGAAEATEQLFFETEKVHRGAYFVEYRPPIINQNFATLFLVFMEPREPRQVLDLMQTELRTWLQHYPVPLMVSACDAAEDLIDVNGDGSTHLVGWLLPDRKEVRSSWKLDDLSEFLKTTPPPANWRTIYRDIPFRTGAQVKENADKFITERRRQILALKLILLLWLAIIPASWAIIQYLGPQSLAFVVLIYGLWQAWRAWLKISGRAKPSPAEIAAAEKKQKMEHYYYHCERNPLGFLRVKAENFEKDVRANTERDAAGLAKRTTNENLSRTAR